MNDDDIVSDDIVITIGWHTHIYIYVYISDIVIDPRTTRHNNNS